MPAHNEQQRDISKAFQKSLFPLGSLKFQAALRKAKISSPYFLGVGLGCLLKVIIFPGKISLTDTDKGILGLGLKNECFVLGENIPLRQLFTLNAKKGNHFCVGRYRGKSQKRDNETRQKQRYVFHTQSSNTLALNAQSGLYQEKLFKHSHSVF